MSHTVYYDSDYVSAEYAFDTTRKSAVIAKRLQTNKNVEVKSPETFKKVTREIINFAHDPRYVSAVHSGTPLSLASAQGFEWDKNIYKMAVAHNAGVLAAVDEVLTSKTQVAGTLSSGLHHASYESGMGFCTFNGLAVAAVHAHDLGAERILMLDFDAHCGGGTRSMTDPNYVVQVDVSTSWFDNWSSRNSNDLLIDADSDDTFYIQQINEALDYVESLGDFDLVIYNAGMDPANSGVSAKALYRREENVTDWICQSGFKTIYTLAGGYTGHSISMSDLADLHELTINAFTRI
jgi:acetoin utilization deacetylase AcuC-like enzyme